MLAGVPDLAWTEARVDYAVAMVRCGADPTAATAAADYVIAALRSGVMSLPAPGVRPKIIPAVVPKGLTAEQCEPALELVFDRLRRYLPG